MESKDTVTFTKSEAFPILKLLRPNTAELVQKLLECQAERSFKAGYNQRRMEEQPLVQEGVRKVVDWVEEICIQSDLFEGILGIRKDEWFAKLKDWGIKR